jgi:competence ComEA-like helix-hairpin-helix protein
MSLAKRLLNKFLKGGTPEDTPETGAEPQENKPPQKDQDTPPVDAENATPPAPPATETSPPENAAAAPAAPAAPPPRAKEAPQPRPLKKPEPPAPKTAPPPPKPPKQPGGDAKKRLRQSQTIRVTPPPQDKKEPTPPPAAGATRGDARSQLRRSQTMRVQPPEPESPPKPPSPTEVRDRKIQLRSSQTIKVLPPSDRQPAPPEDDEPKAALPRIPMKKSEPEPVEPEPAEPEPAEPEPAEPETVSEDTAEAAEAGPEDLIAVPVRALLSRLPSFLRGPSYEAGRFPSESLMLSRSTLAEQLEAGRVLVDLDDVRSDLPSGWVTEDANARVELDFAEVLAAMPDDATGAAAVSETDEAPTSFADLFAPAAADEEKQAAQEAAPPETEVAAEKHAPATETPPAETGKDEYTQTEIDQAVDDVPPDEDEDTEDAIDIPATAALRNVPVEAQGPAWNDNAYPATVFAVDAEELLSQLARGRVVLSTAALREVLPDGWIVPQANVDVELDLAEVVAAIPPERMRPTAEEDEDVIAARSLGELFTPQRPAGPARTAAPRPVPKEAVVSEPPAPADTESAAEAPRPAAPSTVPAGSLAVPVSALLSQLPAEMRGPAYEPSAMPTAEFAVPEEDLLRQLVTGKVLIDIASVRDQLPAGWVSAGASGDVPLDLAQVVAAVPPDLMKTDSQLAEDAQAVAGMPQFFKPEVEIPKEIRKASEPAIRRPPVAPPEKEPEAPAAATVVPTATGSTETGPETVVPSMPRADSPRKTPEPAETERKPDHKPTAKTPKRKGPKASRLPEWNGIEASLEMAPKGIDINMARVDELTRLPGIGEVRAQQIVEFRRKNGRFESIYDLCNLPGIGRTLFRRMTGLSRSNRQNRHAVLNNLLDLRASGAPLLARVAKAIAEQVRAAGCVITNREGIPLAVCGDIAEANRYAALGSRFFFRTQRHLQKFVDRDSDCMIIPGSKPPLLLLSGGDLVIICPLRSTVVTSKRLNRVRKATREVAWLVGPRAVVVDY